MKMLKNISPKWMQNWLNKRPRTLTGYLSLAFYTLLTLLIIQTAVLVLFSASWWRLTLLDSLRPHLAFLSTAIFIGLAAKTSFKSGWLLPLAFVIAIQSQPLRSMTQTLWFPSSITTPINITHINVDLHNETPSAIFDHLNEVQPDIIFFQELSPKFANNVPPNMSGYDWVISQPQTNTQGIGMLVATSAELNILNAEIIYLAPDSQRPLIEATIVHEDNLLHILSWHTIRPSHEWALTFQSMTFDSLIAWANEKQTGSGDVLILGDFNATPWSANFNKLLHEANLQNTQSRYHVRYNTWPAQLPQWLGIPIDNAAHSNGVYTIVHDVGPNIGSDHRPLHLKLVLIKN